MVSRRVRMNVNPFPGKTVQMRSNRTGRWFKTDVRGLRKNSVFKLIKNNPSRFRFRKS